MNIAVFGDLHGKIHIAWLICREWQRTYEQKIDAILSVGDVGVFVSEETMDAATRKHIKKDPDEAGFMMYFAKRNNPKIAALLDEVTANFYFVRGNHEDFEYLQARSKVANGPVPVDAYERVFYIPDGMIVEITNGESVATVTGIGGMKCQSRNPAKRHPLAYLQYSSFDRLLGLRADILLTHEVANLTQNPDGYGDADIGEVIDLMQPAFHFSGHLHKYLPEKMCGRTRSIGLSVVGFTDSGYLYQCCCGILHWNTQKGDFSLIEDTWFQKIHKSQWGRMVFYRGEL